MGSQTPFYKLPYPVGTDRVADGDNAIQALAEAVETTMKGTTNARAWSAVRGGTVATAGPTVWTGIVTVTLTGCPIGATVLVIGNTSLSSATPSPQLSLRLSSLGATIAPAAQTLLVPGLTNVWMQMTVAGLATLTAAAPVINLEAYCSAGNWSVEGGTHVTAVRIV